MPNPDLLYLVALPFALAALAVTLRDSKRTVYCSVAGAVTLSICALLVGLSMSQRGLQHRPELMAILLTVPVMGGFAVGTWPRARRSRWLAFVAVPVAFWVILCAVLTAGLEFGIVRL